MTVAVEAHSLGESYLFLSVFENALKGRVEITLSDLNGVLDLDQNTDGKVSQVEFEEGYGRVESYVSDGLRIASNGIPFEMDLTSYSFHNLSFGKFAALEFSVDNVRELPKVLEVTYSLIFESDPKHRGFLLVEYNRFTGVTDTGETVSLIFTSKNKKQSIDLTVPPSNRGFWAFVREGILHICDIWDGKDHILFLVALILPSVMKREERQWLPVMQFRPAFVQVVKVVTLFTVAHSITLSLAALGIVQLPSRLVESVIAASIAVAALNNVLQIFAGRIWLIIFCFGLFHGFGFASVLTHLGLRSGSLVLSLFGFNIGVEIGQIAVIAAIFPIFFTIRSKSFYPRYVLRFGSYGLTLVALYWFVERAFAIGA